jgi:hypothetical protein
MTTTAPSTRRGGAGGDLEIIEEKVMVAIPRGDEELRFTFTRARTGNGKEAAWHSLRIFWKSDEGEWRPGKQGITIRGKELHSICIALLRACASSIPPSLHETTRMLVGALGGGRT